MLSGMLAAPAVLAAGKAATFTGTVSDAMCGAKHEMAGSSAGCVKGCVKHGSKYALVSGDKVYTLTTQDPTANAELDKLAGEKATISGTLEGDSIAVASVAAAK
jgi:hypothetical protein